VASEIKGTASPNAELDILLEKLQNFDILTVCKLMVFRFLNGLLLLKILEITC
jgi:hypothetical protein